MEVVASLFSFLALFSLLACSAFRSYCTYIYLVGFLPRRFVQTSPVPLTSPLSFRCVSHGFARSVLSVTLILLHRCLTVLMYLDGWIICEIFIARVRSKTRRDIHDIAQDRRYLISVFSAYVVSMIKGDIYSMLNIRRSNFEPFPYTQSFSGSL